MGARITNTLQGVNPGPAQAVSITGTSAQSSAVGSQTNAVVCCATVGCFVALGSNPTAVANTSHFVPPNVPTVLQITPGGKVAVVGTSGTLYVTECA